MRAILAGACWLALLYGACYFVFQAWEKAPLK